MRRNLKMLQNLHEMNVGQQAVIKGICEKDTGLSTELYELGLVPGTEITCLASGPFKATQAYFFRGATFALRPHEAQAILL
jgi:ferrous iron transport protein A